MRARIVLVCTSALASVGLVAAALASPVSASSLTTVPPDPQGSDPYGRVLNVLPPGNSGNVDPASLFALAPDKAAADPQSFLTGLQDPKGTFTTATPSSPANFADQLEKYDALNRPDPRSLTDAALGSYFKGAALGVRPADVVRTEVPRPGTTIRWDRDGVPHITGVTDADVAYGAGIAVMETRMFLTDVLRHTGAATMASFLGPTSGDIAQDAAQLSVAPYTPEQVAAQTRTPANATPEALRLAGMTDAFIAGINSEQQVLCPATTASVPIPGSLGLGFGQHCPVEYAALQRAPTPWTRADLVSIASLVGGIFGTGGGGQFTNAIWLQQLQEKFGATEGRRIYDDLREKNDPESPVTSPVSAPYGGPRGVDEHRPGVAMPDLHPKATQLGTGAIVNLDGSLSPPPHGAAGNQGNASTTDPKQTGALARYGVDPVVEAHQIRGWLARAMAGEQVGMSNELIVDAAHSATGHPTAVFGPQTGYYAPQLLMEEDLRGPHIAARGVSFAGTNFIVSLGRGVDYAWSATSPYTDITDTVIQPLCNTDHTPATVNSTAYVDGSGRCVAMVNYQHTETGLPNIAAQGAPTRVSFLVLRTDHGIVRLRTTVKGRPVAVVLQRSTYGHEVDSILGFGRLNDPGFVHDATSFMTAVSAIQYTFNWYYVDDRDIAYYSSAKLPIRAPGTDFDLPRWGSPAYDWKGFEPFAAHPHVLNPRTGYLANWNNKLAPDFASGSQKWGDGSVYRSLTLTDRIAPLLASRRPVTRSALVGAMIDAGTVDLRGAHVLPQVLAVLGTPADPQDAAAVALLRRWVSAGAHRVDRKRTGAYADQAAIALFDTWWDPNDIGASCAPACGFSLPKDAMTHGLGSFVDRLPEPLDDHPREHIGSAFNGISWYGYLDKDMRSVLGRPVRGPYSRSYCGPLATCRAALRASLHKAVQAALATEKVGAVGSLTYDKTRDDIASVSGGVVGVRPIDWQNRPTFQQVVQFSRHRSASAAAAPAAGAAAASPSAAAVGTLPATGGSPLLPAAAAGVLGLALLARRRQARAAVLSRRR
jgi:acyl-homoserine lactone acylase PvdQ